MSKNLVKKITIDTSAMDHATLSEFLEWVEMFEDRLPEKETSYSQQPNLFETSKDPDEPPLFDLSLDIIELRQDLDQVKETLGTVNDANNVQQEKHLGIMPLKEEEAPKPEEVAAKVNAAVQDLAMSFLIGTHSGHFNRFFRKYVSTTSSELIEITEDSEVANAMIQCVTEAKAGRDLMNPTNELMESVLICILATRSDHKLPLMLDDDQDAFLTFVDEHKREVA
jgi:hypothetical protein